MTPNTACTLSKAGDLDVYGQYTMGAPVELMCAVVKLSVKSQKTSVRADSSASRGNAREIVSDAALLFLPGVDIGIGDKITVQGIDLEVSEILPRFDLRGDLDHNQIGLMAWRSR